MKPARTKRQKDAERDPLKVALDDIGEEGYALDEKVTASWLDEALGTKSPFRASGDGRLTLQLMRAGEVVHVRGRARLSLGAECSRCVKPVSLGLDAPIEVAMFPQGHEPPANADGSLAEDDLGVATYQDEEIDLAGVVHDEVFLELPMNPLCKNDCKGLCQQCGQDKNQGECSCPPVQDPRWHALSGIKLN